jgi:hypothetical protein
MNKKEEIFKSVFGAAWDQLPLVFQKRYRNRSDSNDVITVEGKMDIDFSKTMSCFMPFFKLFRSLVPYKGKNIPVTVDFCSQLNSDFIFLNRKFHFPDKPIYEFNSRMYIIKDTDIVELMPMGIGWRAHCFYDGKKIVMQHKGYVWRILGFNIPIPLAIFLGAGHAEEEVIDDHSYRISMTISHPLLGTLYRYSGNFTFKDVSI